MAPTHQQERQQTGMSLPVTHRYSTMQPDEFREAISVTWQATKAILDTVADQVEQELITPVQGAQVASAITGGLFGFSEFSGQVRPVDLALLNWQGAGNGETSR